MKRFVVNNAVFIYIIILSVILMSCASRIEGSLAADGSAVMNVNVSLEPRMATLIRSLSAAGGRQDGLVLDGPAISQSMSRAPGVASASLRNTNPVSIEGQVRISRVNEFLSPAVGTSAQGNFITFEQRASGGRSTININLQNGPVLLGLLSPEISDYLQALMAPLATGERMTKSEYLDLVAVFYSRALSDEIAYSRIHAFIEFPGNITTIRGGNFSGRRAVFDIPLLDLLVVENPLIYEITWN
ncbi:MAG: hypothetical protein FWC21_01360 [Treponema sp.]|nr:hypothetical protein [Treponema sp.]